MKQHFLILFLLPLSLVAQVDSLENLLKQATHDTTRIKLLSALSEVCELEQILQYTGPILKIAGENLKKKDPLPSAGFYKAHLGNAYNNIGFLAQQEGDVSKALTYYEKALAMAREVKEKEQEATFLNNLAIVYNDLGNIAKALDYWHASLKIEEQLDARHGIARALNNLATVYNKQGDTQKALEYLLRAYEIQKKAGDKVGMSSSLNNIGAMYNYRNEFDPAVEYYKKSLALKEELRDKRGIGITLVNLGLVAQKQKNYADAVANLNAALAIQEEVKDKMGISATLNYLGLLYLEKQEADKAISYGTRAMSLAGELGYPETILNASVLLKGAYREKGQYGKALEMYELFVRMRDSIANRDTKKAMMRRQLQYEYEKKAAADSVRAAEEKKVVQAQLKQEQTQRYALYGGLGLVGLFAVFMVNRFRVTNRQKKIIEEQKLVVEQQKQKVEEKQKEVLDSIYYARRIQSSLMPNEKYVDRVLKKMRN